QRPVPVEVFYVIELEADDAEAFAGLVVAVFGTDAADLDELGTVGRQLHVSISDPDSKSEYLYPATILHSGMLAADVVEAGGISFSPGRYAFREGRRFPVVRPEGPIGDDVLSQAAYFVTLYLTSINWTVVAEPVPRKANAWDRVAEHTSPLLERLDPVEKGLLFRGKPPRVKRPRTETSWPDEGNLAERKRSGERTLVTRRILRKRMGRSKNL